MYLCAKHREYAAGFLDEKNLLSMTLALERGTINEGAVGCDCTDVGEMLECAVVDDGFEGRAFVRIVEKAADEFCVCGYGEGLSGEDVELGDVGAAGDGVSALEQPLEVVGEFFGCVGRDSEFG